MELTSRDFRSTIFAVGVASNHPFQCPRENFGEDCCEAVCSHAAHGGPRWSTCPPATAGGCPKEAVTLWKACAGALLAEAKILLLHVVFFFFFKNWFTSVHFGSWDTKVFENCLPLQVVGLYLSELGILLSDTWEISLFYYSVVTCRKNSSPASVL